jgi:parallel beta-helix repeat protein
MRNKKKRLSKAFSFFLIFLLLASVFISIPANSILIVKDATTDSDGTIRCIMVDDTYIYTGTSSGHVNKFWKSNMTYISQTASYGGQVNDIALDDTYVYAVGDGPAQKVYQYWKSNMTKKSESTNCTNMSSLSAVAVDDEYVYSDSFWPMYVYQCRVYQFWKSNMTKRAESYDCGNGIIDISLDDNYVYFIYSFGRVVQCWKTNMSTRAVSGIYSMDTGIQTLNKNNDDDYVYAAGYGSSRSVNQYWKSNLSIRTASESFGGWSDGFDIGCLDVDDDYVYGGGSENYVNQYWKSNMTKRDQTVSVDNLKALTVDDDYLYIADGNYVYKYYKDIPPLDYYVSNTQAPGWYDWNHTMTIQEAVDNVTDDDGYYDYVIHVWAGTYDENIIVDKPCSIIGNGTDDTFITSDDTNYLFEITSDYVSISYLNISNKKSTGGTGIYLNLSDDCQIIHNYIHDCNVSGIYLFGSNNNIISDNTICDDNGHVNAYGLYGAGGNGNTITNNIIFKYHFI